MDLSGSFSHFALLQHNGENGVRGKECHHLLLSPTYLICSVPSPHFSPHLTDCCPFLSLTTIDLRRKFETPPYSTNVEVGGQAELRCHPPQGNPEPKVSDTPIPEKSKTSFLKKLNFGSVWGVF